MAVGHDHDKKQLNTFVFEIPLELQPYGAAAVARLGYLFDGISFTLDGTQIVAAAKRGLDEEQLRKEISHTLYREKIYQETLPARLSVVRALTRT